MKKTSLKAGFFMVKNDRRTAVKNSTKSVSTVALIIKEDR